MATGENGDLENAASSSTNVSSGDSSVTSSTLSSSSSSSNRDYLSSVRTGKAGMSDYTSQRLAELRLRRTESETASSLSDYRSSKTNGYDSTASKSSSSSIRQNESFSAGDQKSREFYTSKSSSRSVGGVRSLFQYREILGAAIRASDGALCEVLRIVLGAVMGAIKRVGITTYMFTINFYCSTTRP